MNASPKRSALISALLHAAAILLVVTATSVKPPALLRPKVYLVSPRDLAPIAAPHHADQGGGGGQNDVHPATRGDLARRALREFVAPTPVVQNEHPQISIEPAILGDPAPRTYEFPQLGDPNGVLGGLPSGGPGSDGGIGGGEGGGIGNRKGPGYGDHDGGGTDGGIDAMDKFAKTTAPVVFFKPEPEYSDEARKAKVQGAVLLRIEIDEHGLPRNISVRQGLGLGLDEKAMQAVSRWRFHPATRNSRPVATSALVEVYFRLL